MTVNKVTKDSIRLIKPGCKKIYVPGSGLKIRSAQALAYQMNSNKEVEDGYKIVTSADFKNGTLVISKVKE
ncbi:hypothetical protein [Porphyromonas cangingivalis]|uniref:Uncharacterized protein n=1 Tax=Porphyromonas cangingivalis TaxID=36874 RepID=A0A1T4KIQ5_PORCN|nr:hypothetical protein [Porphyromonas cangingivalis]SJZ42245.1 hypothetical protein SAMN02745205_00747 [Porphyromonas cangingivalis]VEJ02639.1 Uncharacterised protein [Porphyromonas cangingivalis]